MTGTRFWLIRHAPVPGYDGRTYPDDEVAADTSDHVALAALARRLPREATWVTTPTRRTQQTVEALRQAGAAVPDTVLIDPAWAEVNMGHLAGKPYEDYEALLTPADFHVFMTNPAQFRAPGGESFVDVCARVGDRLRPFCQGGRDQDIVIVSHGGAIRAALATALDGLPPQALSFAIEPISLTRLEHVTYEDVTTGAPKTYWRVLCVNTVLAEYCGPK